MPADQMRLVAYSCREAAAYLTESLGKAVTERTLKGWRLAGTGPTFMRPGAVKSHVFYTQRDLDVWVTALRASVGADVSA